MSNILLITFILLFAGQNIAQQVVKGKLTDHQGNALPGIQLQLYSTPFFFTSMSSEDGSFIFTGVTDIEDKQLPEGYNVSDNFPNPFYQTTTIRITLPARGNVKVEVFNIFGKAVTNEPVRHLTAGTNQIALALNGLPDGLYFARILINEKYTVIKKMMLLYGCQQSSGNDGGYKHSSNSLNKTNNSPLSITLDSLVATSSIIGRKTFTGLPELTGDTLDLGDLIIERYCPGMPTVDYEGRTYNTVKIGDQCWLKENLDVGNQVLKSVSHTDNGIMEKYCFGELPENCTQYGGLYQWDEAMQYTDQPGSQGICPDGWHIPTIDEFELLAGAAGGSNGLKAIGQGTGDGTGTDASGFSALLAGQLSETKHYVGFDEYANIWLSEERNFDTAHYIYLYYSSNEDRVGYNYKRTGKNVRCIKDSE